MRNEPIILSKVDDVLGLFGAKIVQEDLSFLLVDVVEPEEPLTVEVERHGVLRELEIVNAKVLKDVALEVREHYRWDRLVFVLAAHHDRHNTVIVLMEESEGSLARILVLLVVHVLYDLHVVDDL